MTELILFLHSTNDRARLEDLERHTVEDVADRNWKIWIDASDAGSATLSAGATIDEQISTAIERAFAVVYFVGRTGAGPYQQSIEAPLIEAALAARSQTASPLRFVPVLLREGSDSDLLPWMRQYPLVNGGRDLSPRAIWRAIVERLSQPPWVFNPSFAQQTRAPQDAPGIAEIVAALGRPRNLTLLIGPHADPGPNELGPATMTARLLRMIEISSDVFQPWVPWPSESAEWVRLGRGKPKVYEFFTGHEMTRAATEPVDLLIRIADLAHQWTRRHPRLAGRSDWNGLLLLSTRVDLALEAALLSAPVGFTRLTPGATRSTKNAGCLLQQWTPGNGRWDPDGNDGVGPSTNLKTGLKEGVTNLTKVSLDGAAPVVLVKLCGSIDIHGSLTVTASDLFREADVFGSLPKQIMQSIQGSPQVLVGRGFASPLGQLVRMSALGQRLDGQLRSLVMPASTKTGDSLCDLEMKLLDEHTDTVREAMDLTAIQRCDSRLFLTQLAAAI